MPPWFKNEIIYIVKTKELYLIIMERIEKFKAKEMNLSSVYGGQGEPVQTSEKDEKNDLGCTVHKTDGYIDENGNDERDICEATYTTTVVDCSSE